MSLRITGKNIDLGDILRVQAEAKLNEVIGKYADGEYSGHVTVVKDGPGFKTDCAIHLPHGPDIHVTGEAPDAYASLSVAVERIAKQLRRHKRKRSVHDFHQGTGKLAALTPEHDNDDADEVDVVETTSAGAAIVAEQVHNAPALTVLGAVAAFEQGKASVLVFRNVGTRRINVLYRRDDGHFGWVDIG